jgi:phospholipid-binding lipoprotein MlaA
MQNKKMATQIALVISVILSGCATTMPRVDPKDPWEDWNRSTQSFNDGFDNYLMKPVAKGYDWIMPEFAHHAVTHFFSNIDDIDVFINDALQGKFTQSGMDTARFLVNTTAGIGGLIDVGDMLDLPKHNEDFDQTLGVWGVSAGIYLVLPFFGPSSPRGVAGLVGDAALNPISYTGIIFSSTLTAYAVSGGMGTVKSINTRANKLGLEKVIEEAEIDRYEFLKNAYFERRNYLIHDGNISVDDVLKYDKYNVDDLGPISPF